MKKFISLCAGCLLLLSGVAAKNFQSFTKDTIPGFKEVRLDTSGNTAATTDRVVFEKVEVEASFPGGAQGWKNFIQQNLNSNVPVRKRAPAGYYTVIVQFIVDKKGKVSEISALTNHGYGMEKEVIRVMKKSPDWLPATQNGRTVNAYRKQPITFVVSTQ